MTGARPRVRGTTISQSEKYGGRYRVEHSIASGGMAEVFAARDELLERRVALKLMHPEYARDKSFISRFKREAQAAASLNDPRVVSIYDWGSDNGSYYIVMEYVDGKTLRDIISRDGPLHPESAVSIAADVCAGLSPAHKKGIIHRDIKSANIAVTAEGQTKIMDFGIARAASDSGQTVTQTGMVIGTANYFSPEQAQGLAVDQRSDLYSVGVVLYEMLTREVPFKADTPVAIAYKHVREDPVPPSQLNPQVPPSLDAVVMKALAKNPDNRYQSAQEMRADLIRLNRGEEVEATPILPADQTAMMTPPDRTTVLPSRPVGETGRKRRGVAYALTVLMFLALLGLVGVLLYSLVSSPGDAARVVVPDVVNKAQEEADRILGARGLDASVARREFSDTIAGGFVISQDPGPETKAPRGSRVDLVVSKGPEEAAVPQLTGKTRAEAERLLGEAGLSLGDVSERTDDQAEAGRIVDQSPNAGEKIDRGRSVDIVLSKGTALVRVPEVTGLSESEAKTRLSDAGLSSAVARTCAADESADEVVAQDPEPPEEIEKGKTVTITVNSVATVPSVEDETEQQATDKLRAAGFGVNTVSVSGLGTRERVIRQDPDGGDTACAGDQVTITVARPLNLSPSP
ncbi:MAG: Stk1 family PASTA domain-containing Ser/Thr kinase [Actinomycetota bacterium]